MTLAGRTTLDLAPPPAALPLSGTCSQTVEFISLGSRARSSRVERGQEGQGVWGGRGWGAAWCGAGTLYVISELGRRRHRRMTRT